MPITEWIEKLGRVIFEAPFSSADVTRNTPEMAEIRLAVLDQVKAKTHRVGGREVFPFNRVRIHLRGVPSDQSEVFKSDFFAQFCEQELRAGLTKSNFRFPEDLTVDVRTSAELPGPKGQWLWVEAESETVEAPAPAPVAKKPAKLVVTEGAASSAELTLSKARTNIGRTVDVWRADGPSRRNDLAFSEASEINKTVSREHAHITFNKKTGEYRLFNDRWYKPGSSCGLWIIRDGLSQEVHRTARGVRLMNGDEVHLGKAVLRFFGK